MQNPRIHKATPPAGFIPRGQAKTNLSDILLMIGSGIGAVVILFFIYFSTIMAMFYVSGLMQDLNL